MTAGVATAHANGILNVLRNISLPAVATPFVQLHTGDPGPAGTANASAVTTRNAIAWNTPAGGSMTLATLNTWTMTASETITHVSIWDASTGGTFIQAWALSAGIPVINGSVFQIVAFTLTVTPVAA